MVLLKQSNMKFKKKKKKDRFLGAMMAPMAASLIAPMDSSLIQPMASSLINANWKRARTWISSVIGIVFNDKSSGNG